MDWAFGRAVEFIEEGRESSADDLLLLRPPLQEQVRELVELARRIAFGPKPARPALNGYQLLEEIGHGGMGTVWLARQQRLGGRLVAVKVLPASMGFSPQLRARFRAEAQAIAKLRHPNIVDVYDVIEGGEVRAFAMEWVEGSTLAKVIERSKAGDASRHADESSMAPVREALAASSEVRAMPPDRSYIVFVCRVGVAIARALGAVHRAGIVHRDIKPSNILLRADGTPLLSDFGLARDAEATMMTQVIDHSSRDGAPGGFAGTAAYAAPEQLRADGGEIDGRADIYALGATLYSALALRLPFQGHNHVDVLRQIQLGLVTPLRRINPKLPRDVQTIVAKAMEHDRSQRYQTGDELADDLERLLNLQPIMAKPAGWITRTSKLARRNRASLAAAIIGGLLAMALVALTLTYVIGFPVWSKRRLDEARLTLLDPTQGDSIFSALYWNLPHANGLPVSAAAADLALANYDVAVRFAPFDRELALERDLVRLAREITQRPTPAKPMLPRTDLPLTASLAAEVDLNWNDFSLARNRPMLDANVLASASTDDLRALGLMAMLCGEPVIAMDAWEAHDLRGQSDPLIEACFGIAYLIDGQHGRAYPRLRKAVEAFPNVGFLTVYLAEAAAKCGDLEKAQRWLDEARSMPRLDQFNGLKRVQAGLYDSAGNDEAARKLYQEMLDENLNIVGFHQYARFLENHDELESALLVYLRCLVHESEHLDGRRRFVSVTERWWAALTDEDRRVLAAGKDQPQVPLYGRDAILLRYAQSLQVLNEAPATDGLPRAPQAGRGPE